MATLHELRQLTMDFAHRLTHARKHQGLTQQALADRSAPTSPRFAATKPARAHQPSMCPKPRDRLSVSIDSLAFGDNERGPSDDLKHAFEATKQLDPDEQNVVRELIEAMLLKHEAKRWARAS